MNRRAFTLIELMVVIAIIGTLSSIVLSSLSTARNKGTDSALKQDISEMPAAVELGRIDNNYAFDEYGLACSSTPSVAGGGSNSGTIFADAASKAPHQANSAVCIVNWEPVPPYNNTGSIPGQGWVKYATNAAGALVRTPAGSPGPPGTPLSTWAASVQLSDGTYFCVDQLHSPATTSALTIGTYDSTC